MSRLFNPFKSVTQFFSKTSEKFQALFKGKKSLTPEDEKTLEDILLSADVGVSTTRDIINTLRGALNEETDPKTVLSHLLYEKLKALEKPLQLSAHPFVILMVGVNGAGKTTTIGKLTHYFKSQGKSVMLAAGDTFRAAATEQLQKIAEKNGFTAVIAQESGADSAALIFDAYQSAKAKKVDVLIADTAGRLHTQAHLMKELQKILRVLKKIDETAPHEILLVLDAHLGQNALLQAKKFHDMVNVSGIVLTKLDGTAKGGIIFAIAEELKIPLRFIGFGETADDFAPFDAKAFVEALLGQP
jgi:fused signal recognition particle receptor